MMPPALPTLGPGMPASISSVQRGSRIVTAGKSDAAGPSEINDKRLNDACNEFESLFIYYMLKEMRASIPKDGYLGQSMQSETYTSMFDMEIARELSGERGLGLADFLRQHLINRLEEAEAPKAKKEIDFY